MIIPKRAETSEVKKYREKRRENKQRNNVDGRKSCEKELLRWRRKKRREVG